MHKENKKKNQKWNKQRNNNWFYMIILPCYRWFLEWSTSGKIKHISVDAFADHSAKLTKRFLFLGAVVVLAWIHSKIKKEKDRKSKKKKKINNSLLILKYDSM